MELLDASKTSVTHRGRCRQLSRVCSFEGAFVVEKKKIWFEEERSEISKMETERLPWKGRYYFEKGKVGLLFEDLRKVANKRDT